MSDHNVINARWSLQSIGTGFWQGDFCFERFHGEIPFVNENFALQIVHTRADGIVIMPATHAGVYGDRVRDITSVLTQIRGIRDAWVRPDSIVIITTNPDITDVARHAISAVWGPNFTIAWQQDRRGGTDRRTVSRDTPDRRASTAVR